MIKRSEELDKYLTMTVDKGGSDLHLQTGSRPAIRILGEVVFLDEEELKQFGQIVGVIRQQQAEEQQQED